MVTLKRSSKVHLASESERRFGDVPPTFAHSLTADTTNNFGGMWVDETDIETVVQLISTLPRHSQLSQFIV